MPRPTYNLIQEIVVSGSVTSTVTFSSIPNTYTDLVLTYSGKNAADQALKFRINGDTGANYNYAQTRQSGGTAGQTVITNDNSIDLTANGAETNNYFGFITIAGYTNTNWQKTGYFSAFIETSYGVTGSYRFASTSTVTSLSLLTSSGTNFVAGSTFQLFGIRGND